MLKITPYIGKQEVNLYSWGRCEGEKRCILAKIYSIVLEQVILVLDCVYFTGQISK